MFLSLLQSNFSGRQKAHLLNLDMRRFLFLLLLLTTVCMGPAVTAATESSGKVLKVLPEFFDQKGHNAIAPSLYDRDAYQANLRKKPALRSTIGFFVNWKAKKVDVSKLKLRVQMRSVYGNIVKNKTIEENIKKKGWFTTWTTLKVSEEDYKKFGELIAWRVTLWEGDKLLSEQTSFLW